MGKIVDKLFQETLLPLPKLYERVFGEEPPMFKMSDVDDLYGERYAPLLTYCIENGKKVNELTEEEAKKLYWLGDVIYGNDE